MAESPGASPHLPSSVLTDVRFWHQIIGDAKRTIVCPPALETKVREAIEQYDMGHLSVKVSPACPENRVLVIDEQAIQAELSKPIVSRFF